MSSVRGGRNPEQAKELGKATGEDESTMMSSARGDRTPEKQAKDAGEGTSKVTTRIGYIHNLSEVIRNKAEGIRLISDNLRQIVDVTDSGCDFTSTFPCIYRLFLRGSIATSTRHHGAFILSCRFA